MKITKTLLAFLVASGSIASASTIFSGAANDVSFATSTSSLLDSSFEVRVGWLDTATYDESDYAVVNTNFIELGAISFPYAGNPTYNGFYNGQVDYVDADFGGEALGGENIFLFVTDGSTEWALMEYTNAAETINLEADIPNVSNVFVELSTIADFTLHSGSHNSGTVNLQAIPEPSAALLGGLGSLMLLRRRRKQD